MISIGGGVGPLRCRRIGWYTNGSSLICLFSVSLKVSSSFFLRVTAGFSLGLLLVGSSSTGESFFPIGQF